MTIRHRRSRRTTLRTIGSLGTAALGLGGSAGVSVGSSATGDSCDVDGAGDGDGADDGENGDAGTGDDLPDGATRYAAVVDRIVDGERVVLLLEKDDEPVDQLVVSVDEFDDVAEGDRLTVDARDSELLDYCHVDERPPGGV